MTGNFCNAAVEMPQFGWSFNVTVHLKHAPQLPLEHLQSTSISIVWFNFPLSTLQVI